MTPGMDWLTLLVPATDKKCHGSHRSLPLGFLRCMKHLFAVGTKYRTEKIRPETVINATFDS
jgi:hypothetical protein